MGIEQFFWALSIALVFIQFIIYNKFRFHLNYISILLMMFLVVHGLSFFSIQENMRYITFFRNISTYITALMLLVICCNVIDTWSQIEKLLRSIVFTMFIASIFGLLAFSFEIFRVQFKSPMGYLLPDIISNTDYGGVIAKRNVGYYSWFALVGSYFRASSFFLYSTMFSSALVIVIPVALFLRNISIGIRRRYYSLVVLIMLLALLATTGRVAILSLIIGYILFKYMSIDSHTIKLVLISFISLFVLLLLFWLDRSGILYQIIDLILYSRGEGSVNSRLNIYVQTFENFLRRPIFGWGTERDVIGLSYPLGSHSYYLGILYKQGAIGFFLFIAIILCIWKNIAVSSKITDKKAYKFLKYGKLILLVYILNSFTDVLDLDATTIMFSWLIFSLLIAAKKNLSVKLMNEND